MKKNLKYFYWQIIIITCLFCTMITLPSLSSEHQITEKGNSPLVLMHFDDGYSGVYENAFPLMQEYGYLGTIFMPTNFIDRPKHMHLEELKEMEAQGWEIGSHTKTHPDLKNLSPDKIYDEIVGSRNFLIAAQLLTLDDALFCSPMTVWDTEVAILVSKNYRAARSKDLIIFQSPIQPPQQVRVILKDTEIECIEHWIIEAVQANKWLILVFHEIAEGGNEYFFAPTKFREVLDLLKKYQAQVSTIANAITVWEKINDDFQLDD